MRYCSCLVEQLNFQYPSRFNTEEYGENNREVEDFLWSAIEEYIPNARERAVKGTVQIGTPLTHERFLRRTRGAYG